MSTLSSPSFQAGGLASGLDTNSIIDGLVSLQQQPIDALKKQESGIRSQISILGDVASTVSALDDAARALATGGVLATQVTSSATGYRAATGSGAVAGTYGIQVDQLALAAKSRSNAFGAGATASGGTLTLTLDGQHPPWTTDAWKDGASLQDVADAIRATGAPVSAVVLSDGTSSWLSVTRSQTGYSGDQQTALRLDVGGTGSAGQALSFTPFQYAQNAELQIDGIPLTRTSNVVADALPGTTLTLQARTTSPEELVVSTDATATEAALQHYVDAYNAVNALVQRELSPARNTDRSTTLTGDSSMRSLQSVLQSLGAHAVEGSGSVRSLADLGVKTSRDGSLSIDGTTLSAAIARDPAAVDALFATASSGIADVVHAAASAYVDPVDGILVQAQSSLQDRVERMDDQATQMQERLDGYRASLVAQFTAMEDVVSRMKSVGSFLSAQSQSQQSSK